MSMKATELVDKCFRGWSSDRGAVLTVMYRIAWRVYLDEDADNAEQLSKLEEFRKTHKLEKRQVVIPRDDFIIRLNGNEFLEIRDNPDSTPEQRAQARKKIEKLNERIRTAFQRLEECAGLYLRCKTVSEKGNITSTKPGHASVYYFPTREELKDAEIRKRRYDQWENGGKKPGIMPPVHGGQIAQALNRFYFPS